MLSIVRQMRTFQYAGTQRERANQPPLLEQAVSTLKSLPALTVN